MAKKTIAIDFDGVIHSYESGWKGATTIPDPPVEGALEFIEKALVQDFDVVIVSTRARWPWGRWAIRAWLKKHGGWQRWYNTWGNDGLESVKVTNRKVPALVYIDDRAHRFTGVFDDPKTLALAPPWNKARG